MPKSVKGHNADTRSLDEFAPLDGVMNHIDKYDGIGIALAGGIAAIDIDYCIIDGKLSDMAQSIITKADEFVYDKECYYIHNRTLGLEVYVSRDKGYVIVTGNVLADKPIMDITDFLPEILDKYMQ